MKTIIKTPKRKKIKQKHFQLDSCVQIKFPNDHQNILKNVIDILKSPQVMSFSDFEKPFVSHTLQTHHVDSTLKRRRLHVVSTWNPRGVLVGQ